MDMYEEFSDGFDSDASRLLLEQSKQEFIEGCYEAYDVLVSEGSSVLEQAPATEIQKAINRMTQLFLLREEYERCEFLKKYVADYLPGFKIVPDRNVIKELSL